MTGIDLDPGTLTLRLELGAEPIAGTIGTGAEQVAFSGWVELASLIDRFRSRTPGDAADLSRPPAPPARPQAPPAM